MEDVDKSRLAELTEAAAPENMVEIAARSYAPPSSLNAAAWAAASWSGWVPPDVPPFTRALGLGFIQPLTGDVLDESLDYLRGAGGSALLVQLSPFVETPEVLELLASRGMERGRTWAKMMRPMGPPPPVSCDLRIEEVGPERAEEFAHVLLTGMEMPLVMAPFAMAQMDAPGWSTFAAFDGLRGAAWVTADTGSEEPDDPIPSLHNMRRAGIDELYARQNWLLRL